MRKVDIRFNTNFPSKSKYEWRLLIDGIEHLVNVIRCKVPTWTTSTFIEGHGQKWHMTCEASEISIDRSFTDNIIATIK